MGSFSCAFMRCLQLLLRRVRHMAPLTHSDPSYMCGFSLSHFDCCNQTLIIFHQWSLKAGSPVNHLGILIICLWFPSGFRQGCFHGERYSLATQWMHGAVTVSLLDTTRIVVLGVGWLHASLDGLGTQSCLTYLPWDITSSTGHIQVKYGSISGASCEIVNFCDVCEWLF